VDVAGKALLEKKAYRLPKRFSPDQTHSVAAFRAITPLLFDVLVSIMRRIRRRW